MVSDFMIVSITTGIVIIILAAVSALFPYKMKYRWFYVIWFLIALRLLIPININWSEAPIQLTQSVEVQKQAEVDVAVSNQTAALKSVDNEASTDIANNFSVFSWLMLIWGIGAFAFFVYHLGCYWFFLRRIRPWCRKMQIDANISVYYCKVVSTPMLVGFFQPRILLPQTEYNHERCFLKERLRRILRYQLCPEWIMVDTFRYGNDLAAAQ